MRLFALIIGTTVLDQLAKFWVQSRFLYAEELRIVPGLFSLHYIRNTGAAWGMLSGWRYLLVFFSIAMLALILRQRRTMFYPHPGGRLAVGLLAGGIIGNLIDRVRLGYVVDFLDFYHGQWHFPAFNIADSAICVGVGLYLLGQFRAGRNPSAEQGR